MNLKYYITVVFCLFIDFCLQAQIAKGYEVATWYQFKPAALSYTFDDNSPHQLTIALPLFDQYQYKTTHFTVSGWIKDWTGLNRAAQNGHEIASHTISHPRLSLLSDQEQEIELQKSQQTILNHVANNYCQTIAYPFCDTGNIGYAKQYFIAGRVCTNTIEQSTPKNFYAISSIPLGSQSAVARAKDMDSVVLATKAVKGWSIFLIHGIDDDGGYSPTLSSDLRSHLKLVHEDSTSYWVATFVHVVKYIKERNALKILEKAITNDSLRLSVTDQLEDTIYNVPISLKRVLPKGWADAKVYKGNKQIPSQVITKGSLKYLLFEVVPDRGVYFLSCGK